MFVTTDGSSLAAKVDPLECPHCGGRLKITSFIERRQQELIERILRGHQSGAMVNGLWKGPIRTRASPRAPSPGRDAANDRQLVLYEEFLECQRLEHRLENRPVEPCELQLVLDERVSVAFLPAGAQCKDDARVDRYLLAANSFRRQKPTKTAAHTRREYPGNGNRPAAAIENVRI